MRLPWVFFLASLPDKACIVAVLMKRSGWLYGSGLALLFCVFSLSGCGGRHAETVRKVQALLDQPQFDQEQAVPALQELTTALQQDPKDVHLRRLYILLVIRYERVDIAFAAYEELCKISTNDQVLMDALRHKDPKMRTGAARVLGFVGTPLAEQGLERLLSDSDRDVRRAAVAALGEIHDKKATQGLILALKDDWWNIRMEAAEALGKIRDVDATEPLYAALEDSDSSVQLAAKNAILTLSRQPKAPHDIFVKHAAAGNSPQAQYVSMLSLAVLKDPSVVPQLIQLAASTTDTRQRAETIRALGLEQDPAGLAVVRKAMTDPEPAVRLNAVESIGLLHDNDSIPALKTIVANESEAPLIRRAASTALATIQTPGLDSTRQPPDKTR
jgi:HEAT repeat protein